MQQLAEGPCCALTWNASGPDYFLAIQVATTRDEALARSRATYAAARESGFERLHDEHVAAWAGFWAASAVYLPEADKETLWYYGLYLLASASRRGCFPPGLQGLWAMDGVLPPWRGDYHADMNVQETFWPAGASGHLELLDTWVDHMAVCLPRAREFTRRFFGTAGTFWPCSFLPEYTIVPSWGPVQFAWSNTGWLAWLVWLRWRYSLDTEWLRETGYALVAECFEFYRANLERGADGLLHVPLSSSPEFRENGAAAWGPDPNVDLALIRRTCDWLLEMEAALGGEEYGAAAREVREHLAPYAFVEGEVPGPAGLRGERVLALWPGQPLTESHRHPSHLMAIHPAMDLTVEGDEEQRRIIADSLTQFLELGQYRWAGHTYAQWISFAACLGRAGMAADALGELARHWLGPNGLHFNNDYTHSGRSYFSHPPGVSGPFTMEANCGLSMGLCDMLLQGWNDRLRVFPAVPDRWRDVVFRDLVAEGAFRVSAARLDGRTAWVRLTATVDRPLRLRDPFEGEPITIDGAELVREGEDYVGALEAGQQVILAREGVTVSLEEAVARVRASDTGVLGLR